MRGFRALRALRPLRMISKDEGMKTIVNSFKTAALVYLQIMIHVWFCGCSRMCEFMHTSECDCMRASNCIHVWFIPRPMIRHNILKRGERRQDFNDLMLRYLSLLHSINHTLLWICFIPTSLVRVTVHMAWLSWLFSQLFAPPRTYNVGKFCLCEQGVKRNLLCD